MPKELEAHDLGLGRMAITDGRDTRFPMLSILPRARIERTRRYWFGNGWWGNQGSLPHCVGYAWTHYLEDGPITHKGAAPIIQPAYLYREAQKLDEWPGENYAGTSVRGAAKFLQRAGKIGSYLWAFDMETVVRTLLTTGPVVVGTNWYESMFYPDYRGIVKVDGPIAGGHAYLANGVNTQKRMVRFKNSWGREWGENGYFWMGFDDLSRLIREDGEACLAVEVPTSVKP